MKLPSVDALRLEKGVQPFNFYWMPLVNFTLRITTSNDDA
jgi:hypothetical protein